MAKSYTDWLDEAENHRIKLEDALNDKDPKGVIYHRGKYIRALKKAHQLNPTGVVSTTVTGAATPLPIEHVIQSELKNHQRQIDVSLKEAKRTVSIKNACVLRESKLKIRRLIARADQMNFARGVSAKNAHKKELAKESASLAATSLIKAPVMTTMKVTSVLGPLTVKIALFPAKFIASGLSIFSGNSDVNVYNNTVVHQFSRCLEDAVKTVSVNTYETVGRM